MVPAPKHDEKEELFEQIRDLHATKPSETRHEGRFSLDCLELGELIATGCNAAVYEARLISADKSSVSHYEGLQGTEIREETDSDFSVISEEDAAHDSTQLIDEETDISSVEDDCSEVEEYEIFMSGPDVGEEAGGGNHDVEEDSLSFSIIDVEEDPSLPSITDAGRLLDDEGISGMIVDKDSLSDISIIQEDPESDDSNICDPAFKLRGDQPMSDLNLNLTPIDPGGASFETGTRETTPDDFDLAVKMMFNYDAESNAEAIMRAMDKEVVPLTCVSHHLETHQWSNGNRMKKKAWPPHPNIVLMHGLFVGAVPDVPDNIQHYPAALPTRIFSEGLGRNMTLFLVMKRYSCTLSEFLSRESPSMATRCFLLCQLLEGVAFLQQQVVAHRDLKSDNLLIDLSGETEYPRLVISDFGCCLNEGTLLIPYVTSEINKGGNSALMAPEIACAEAGSHSVLDYRKADQWAAGALVYEIMGCPNPFYRSRSCSARLDSRTYREEDLPRLPDEVPGVVKKLARNLLDRDTRQRLSAAVAATVLQLHINGLSKHININNSNSSSSTDEMKFIQNWAVNNTARTILTQLSGSDTHSSVPSDIMQAFLSRISHSNVERALCFLQAV